MNWLESNGFLISVLFLGFSFFGIGNFTIREMKLVLRNTINYKNYTKKVAKKSDKVKEKPKFKIKKTYDIVDVNSEFPFGKHKGVIFSNIVKKDKKYLQWCLENVGGLTLTEEAKKLLV
jgi:hypothetical protein